MIIHLLNTLIYFPLTSDSLFFLRSFAHPGLAADRGHYGLGPALRHHQARLPPLGGGVLHPGLCCG